MTKLFGWSWTPAAIVGLLFHTAIWPLALRPDGMVGDDLGNTVEHQPLSTRVYMGQKVTLRNEEIRKIVAELMAPNHALSTALTSIEVEHLSGFLKHDYTGYREVVLICMTAALCGFPFDPVRGSYRSCNPRGVLPALNKVLSIYGIRIKNGALNVAKGEDVIDLTWATSGADKKGSHKAKTAVVRLLESVFVAAEKDESAKKSTINVGKAKEVARAIIMETQENTAKARLTPLAAGPSEGVIGLAEFFTQLMMRSTDGGRTPQLIATLVLRVAHGSNAAVNGGGSVHRSNATSGAPGDIWVDFKSGPIAIYEVSYKKIDFERLSQCNSSLKNNGYSMANVTWLCRSLSDVELPDGKTEFKIDGIIMTVIEMESWIICMLEFMGRSSRKKLVKLTTKSLKNSEYSQKTRNTWNQLCARL